MAISNNSPTFDWIKISGVIVTYFDKSYIVMDKNTNDKYVYWNAANPHQLETSNTMLARSQTMFLVVSNEKGIHTIVPSTTDNFEITFDGDSVKNINKNIHGLYEQNKVDGERFVAIETDINGIHTTVGRVESDLTEKISKVDQKADGISASVSTVQKEYKDDKEVNALRENLNKSFIKLNSDLGLFKGETNGYFKDNQVSQDEINKINATYLILDKGLEDVVRYINEVIAIATKNNITDKIPALNSCISSLNSVNTNLKTIINTAISDFIITSNDYSLIANAFAQYTLKVTEAKNTCDGVVLLGTGGKIVEELARIDMKSNEIDLSVSKKVNNNEIISSINLSPESIKIKSNKIDIEGLVTFSDLTDGTTTISGNNIKTGYIQGIRIEAMSNNSGCVLDDGGIQFYNWKSWWDGEQCGAISYDSNGISPDAQNRLWIRSTNGYVLKLQSSGNMSLEAGSSNKIYLMNSTSVSGEVIANSFVTGDGFFKCWYGNSYFPQVNVWKDAMNLRMGNVRLQALDSLHLTDASGTDSATLWCKNANFALTYSLNETVSLQSERYALSEVLNLNVVNTSEGYRILGANSMSRTLSTDSSNIVNTTIDEENNKVNCTVDTFSTISTLCKAMQEQNEVIESLKIDIMNLQNKGV